MCFTRRVYFWDIIKILPLSPQPPSPPGKGETLGYFMQGASPLASPGRSPGGTGSTGAGGAHAYEPGRRWLRAENRASGGGLAFFAACRPCRLFTFLPPSPRPPSPMGKGETLGYFMQGAKPLASPGLSRGGTGSGRGWRRPAYEPGRRWLRAGNRAPARGGLGVYSPDLFLVQHKDFAPIPPTPFPAGRGRL